MPKHPRESSGLPEPSYQIMWVESLEQIEEKLNSTQFLNAYLSENPDKPLIDFSVMRRAHERRIDWYTKRVKELKTFQLLGVGNAN